MPSILAYGLNAALYAALGAVLARSLWRADAPPADTGMSWVRIAILAPLGLQTWLLYRDVFTPAGMALGVGSALSAIVWMSVLIYWAGSFVYRTESLHALVVPVAAVAAIMPAFLPAVRPLPNASTGFFQVHLTLSIMAYSLFTIASVHALLMAVVEKRLHSGALPALLRSLPPLLALENILFRIIGLGFLLLTASLGSGMLFSEELFGMPLKFTHKVVFSILSWLVFGGLLVGRLRWGWRGRKALRWTMAGFLMLVLAYIGSKFVFEVLKAP